MFRVLLFIHVLGGAVGLLALAIPLITKKGGRTHVRAGWVFVAGMLVASIGGILITLGWLAAPLAIKPPAPGQDLAEKAASVRIGAVFLGTVGLLTLNALWQGVRAIARKRAPEPRPKVLDVALPIALGLAGIAATIIGVSTGRWLLVVFGALGISGTARDLRFVLRPLESPMAWWYQHMNSMMAAIIGAVTAFLVFNAARFFPDAPQWLAWIGPSLVIVPGFQIWIARYQRKFERRLALPPVADSVRA